MTHTPWTVNLSGTVVLADEAPAGDNLIARCYGSHAIEHARLIAAAPETAAERDKLKAINAELLAALQNIIPRFERCIIVSGTSEELAMIATKAARATLAKAQGDQ